MKHNLFPAFIVSAAIFSLQPLVSAAITAGSKNIGPVWFIGDSITEGNPGDGPSARAQTYNLLSASGYTFISAGSYSQNRTGIARPDLYFHSGYAGGTIAANVHGLANITQNIQNSFANGTFVNPNPNVIFIMLGTNDISHVDPATTPDRLETFINMIYNLPGITSSPTVFVSSIPPNYASPSSLGTNTIAYNATLPALVNRIKNGPGNRDIYFMDNNAVLGPGTMSGDGIHPNAAGNQAMALNYFDTIASRVAVPEASSLFMASLGVTVLYFRRRRK